MPIKDSAPIMDAETIAALGDVAQRLAPYRSVSKEYQQTKAKAADLFPHSEDPESTLYCATCFAEDWLYLTGGIKNWHQPVEKISEGTGYRMPSMEWSFSYIINGMEGQIDADDKLRPYVGHNFLARNMKETLEPAAERLGIEVVTISNEDLFSENGEEDISGIRKRILRGEVIAKRTFENEDGETSFDYLYVTGLANPGQNAAKLMGLLGEQLAIARERGDITDLGDRMEPLFKNPGLQKFVAERFEEGREWTQQILFALQQSPSYYLSYNSVYLPKDTFGTKEFDISGYRTSNISGVTIKDAEKAASFFESLKN